jgi:hypothetical protein
VSEGNTWVVPGYYYKADNPDRAYPWDGSPEAWAWKQVRDIADEMFIEGAARTLAIMGNFEHLPGLMENAGWVSAFTIEGFEEFLQAHEDEIRRRVASIRAGAG